MIRGAARQSLLQTRINVSCQPVSYHQSSPLTQTSTTYESQSQVLKSPVLKIRKRAINYKFSVEKNTLKLWCDMDKFLVLKLINFP